MIIVFGNQKGGCGKTTNCIQFANYLAELGKQFIVLDLDFQRSLSDRREADLNTYDNKPKYEIIASNLENVAQFFDDYKTIDDGIVLIDLPGKIDDNALGTILREADIIICPFRYDKLTMDSTGFFIKLLVHLKVKAKLFFLPNNIKKVVRYETKEEIIKRLGNFGFVTKEIPDRVAMERVNTLLIDNECINVVKESYDYIIEKGNIV